MENLGVEDLSREFLTEIRDEIIKLVGKKITILDIRVVGSYAFKTADKESDLDILIMHEKSDDAYDAVERLRASKIKDKYDNIHFLIHTKEQEAVYELVLPYFSLNDMQLFNRQWGKTIPLRARFDYYGNVFISQRRSRNVGSN